MLLMVACSDKSTDSATASDDAAGEDGGSGTDDGGSDGGDASGDAGSGEDGGSGDSGSGDSGSGDSGSGDSGSGDSGSGEDGGSGDSGSGEDDGGDDEGGEDGGTETLSIAGNYTSDTGEEHAITESYWSMDFGAGEVYEYNITQYDNGSAWLVAENRSGEEAGYWSRFDWFVDSGGTLYVCQTDAFAATESDALTTSPADSSDLTTGCPYYGWLLMTPI
jgi:hypothetical protein